MDHAWEVMIVATFGREVLPNTDTVRQWIAQGKLGPNDCLRPVGQSAWQRISDMPDLLQPAKSAAPPSLFDDYDVTAEIALTPPSPEPAPEARRLPTPDAPEPVRYTIAPPPKKISRSKEKKEREDKISSRDRFLERADELESQENPPLHDDDDEGHPTIARRHSEVEEFDLTPMVDLTFLLNMFFMLTTNYGLLRSIEMAAAKKESTEQGAGVVAVFENELDQFIVVTVNPDNSITVDDEAVSIDRLAEKLEHERTTSQRTDVIIRGDPASTYQTIVKIIDLCHQAGLPKARLAVEAND